MADETSNTAVEQQKEESTPAPEVQKEVEKPVENGESTEAKAAEEEKPEEVKTDGEATGAEGDKQNETPAENPLEAPKESPFSDEDYEKLLQYADENEEGWEKMKNKHKGLTLYKRSDKTEKNGMPLVKGVFDLPTISFDRAVELFTDLDERKKWNKKMISEVLETREDFRILYTTIKLPPPYTNRDIVQCAASKKSEDPKQNAYVFKACNHPNKPPNKSTITRAELLYGGLLVKPGADENASQVIVVNQINMKGWIPKALLHKMNNSYPSTLFDDLSSFLKKAAAAAEKEAAAAEAAAAAATAAAAAAAAKEEGDKAEAKEGEKKEGTDEAAAKPEKKEDEEKKEENAAVQNGEKEEEAKTEETPKAETNGDAEEKKEEKTEEAAETTEAS